MSEFDVNHRPLPTYKSALKLLAYCYTKKRGKKNYSFDFWLNNLAKQVVRDWNSQRNKRMYLQRSDGQRKRKKRVGSEIRFYNFLKFDLFYTIYQYDLHNTHCDLYFSFFTFRNQRSRMTDVSIDSSSAT